VGVSERPSLALMLDAVAAALPPALVSGAARRRLRALAARLPFIPCVGLECHLGASAPRVDLLTYTSDWDVLRAWADGVPLARATARSRALIDRWVDAFVLEFDADGARPQPPAMFLNFRPDAIVDEATLLELAGCLIGPLPAGAEGSLRRCAAAAGDDLQVTHLGVMTSRAGRPLRVNLGTVAVDALTAFASAMAWPPERRAALGSLVDLVRPFAHHVVLAVDIDEAAPSRLGLECYLPSTSEGGAGWGRMLARIGADGMCTAEEATALLEWPRRTADHGIGWPPAYARVARFLGPGYGGVMSRTVNHLKLISTPGEPLRAKAYLLARHEWSGRSR
jgi:hypothetical protein